MIMQWFNLLVHLVYLIFGIFQFILKFPSFEKLGDMVYFICLWFCGDGLITLVSLSLCFIIDMLLILIIPSNVVLNHSVLFRRMSFLRNMNANCQAAMYKGTEDFKKKKYKLFFTAYLYFQSFKTEIIFIIIYIVFFLKFFYKGQI